MAVPVSVFRLYRYEASDECTHDLLVRAGRPGCANADEGAIAAADDFVGSADRHLQGWWEKWVLSRGCGNAHHVRLVAETQELPTGEELYRTGLRELDVWAARDKAGDPWVIMGTATDESAFWEDVHGDPDLMARGPEKPARRYGVYFITDQDGGTQLR